MPGAVAGQLTAGRRLLRIELGASVTCNEPLRGARDAHPPRQGALRPLARLITGHPPVTDGNSFEGWRQGRSTGAPPHDNLLLLAKPAPPPGSLLLRDAVERPPLSVRDTVTPTSRGL
ncbi:MAG: hypothetical protein QW394_08430 [Thermofilaceae archaeon]